MTGERQPKLMTEAALVPVEVNAVELGTLRASEPAELIARATELATPLAKLIKDRQLFNNISGRQHVRCEGWTTLAAMLGVTPHEVSVDSDDGTYVAVVELRRLSDGMAVGRASAECGGEEEPMWNERAPYARRSMALTRATAKACRLTFSWIMVLAGYDATPAEEMPADDREQSVPVDQVPFGEQKGKSLAECSTKHLRSMFDWCRKKGKFTEHAAQMGKIIAERARDGEAGTREPGEESEQGEEFPGA